MPRQSARFESPLWQEGFTAIPNRLLERADVSPTARLLLALLMRFAWQSATCHPSQATLAAKLGIGERMLRNYVRELEEAELVECHRRPNVSTEYLILPLADRQDASDPVRQDSSASDRHDLAAEEHSEEKDSTTPLQDPPELSNGNGSIGETLETEFEIWLADYREVTGRRARGSKPARVAFYSRRRDGYSLDDLKLATRGCHSDEFCRRNGHDVPTTILRASKVDRYIELGRQAKGVDEPMRRETPTGDGGVVPEISTDGGKTWQTDYERRS